MNFKRFGVICGIIVLAAVLVFSWGCQNQPTGPITKIEAGTPTASSKIRDTGSCTAGSFKISFNGSFVSGLGWSTGSSRSISWSGSGSGLSWGPGVYGWMQNPLVEYYIPRSGGSNKGSYSCGGSNWNVGVTRRTNQPSIEGTASFDQYFASGGGQPIDMSCHYSGWRNVGLSVGSQNYQVVAVENWSGGSGSASVSVPNSNWYTHWVGSGSATFTCGGGGGGSTTTTSGGSTTTSGGGSTTTSGGGGSTPIVVRGRSTDGQGRIDVKVGGNTITSWTLGTGMANWETSTQYSGGLNVCFTNDADNRDVQIDYVKVDGQTRQSENQSYNTGVWQDGSCGGSNSEWLHCNGCIGYGDVSGGGGGSTTTTSGGSWWGGGSWWW